MKASARKTSAAPRKAAAVAAVAAVDLQLFCPPNPKHPALGQPWNYGPYTYATDACVMVRVPARPKFASDPLSLGTGAETFFAEYPLPPAKALSELPALPRSKGMNVPCPECHGSGAVLNRKGLPLLCACCGGERHVLNRTAVDVGVRRFAAHYLYRLATLPGLRIAAALGKPSEPLRFVFDGGDGLLMPLRK